MEALRHPAASEATKGAIARTARSAAVESEEQQARPPLVSVGNSKLLSQVPYIAAKVGAVIEFDVVNTEARVV